MDFIIVIIDLIDDRIMEIASQTFARLAEILTGGLEILAVLLIVLYGINVLFRFTEFSFPQLIGIMIRIGAIYMFLFSWDNFNIIYSAATSLFDTVGNTVRDFVAGPATDSSGDAATDMFRTLAEVIDLVVNGNSVLVRALVGAFLFVVLGILAVVYILVVAYAKLLLAVLISIAPLMGFFLLFPRTRSMFEAWLAAVFGYLIYPIAIGAVIGIIAGLLLHITVEIDASTTILSVLGFITVAGLGIKMLADVPSIASSLTGQFNLGSMSGAASAAVNPMGAVRSRARSFATGYLTGRTPMMQARATDKAYANYGMAARGVSAERGRAMQAKFSEIDRLRKASK